MYSIDITYRTGDSFGSHTVNDLVGAIWDDLDEAKEALKIIKEHHIFISSREYRYSRGKTKTTEIEKNSWYAGEYSIYVPVNGKKTKISTFWVGWFESLIKAEIVIDDPDLVFEV